MKQFQPIIGFITFLQCNLKFIDKKLEMLECHESQIVWMREHDNIDFPDMVRTCSRYRGYQCGADYAEGFRQCQVYLKGTAKRLLP